MTKPTKRHVVIEGHSYFCFLFSFLLNVVSFRFHLFPFLPA